MRNFLDLLTVMNDLTKKSRTNKNTSSKSYIMYLCVVFVTVLANFRSCVFFLKFLHKNHMG